MRQTLFRSAAPLCGLLLLGLGLGPGGCALTSKAQATYPRYFSATPPAARTSPRTGDATRRSGIELRLGRVTASAYIRDKIVVRESRSEISFYDDRLWTERPSEALRRELANVLFEQEGIRSVVTGFSPTLDVDLVSFEEVRAPQHTALAQVTLILRNDRTVLSEQTLTIERPIPQASKKQEAAATAEALAEALRGAVLEIKDRVLQELNTPASAPATATSGQLKPQAAAAPPAPSL